MTVTSPFVSFGLYAQTVKQDATFAFDDDLQPFSKILDLKTGNFSNRPYITYEQDFWLLDGNYKFKPTADATVHVGLIGLDMSDDAGDFAVPPTLTITFSLVHSMDAMTLRGSQLSDDYANSVHIAYYDDTDTLISEADHVPTSWEYSTEEAVTDFKKIEITFNSTNKPYRYLRLQEINFGSLYYFTSADIKSCSVVEEVNPLSIELPIDTCELTLYSNNPAFRIISPTGEYAELQNRQPLDVYENVGNDQFYIGQFYLDTWENTSETTIVFKAIDMLGILDTIPYAGHFWDTPGTAVEDILETVMAAINIPYDLDPDLYGIVIRGAVGVGDLPKVSYRNLLQQIAFVCGAYITCSRAGTLQINKTVLAKDLVSYDYTVLKAEKGIQSPLTLKSLVTGAEVTAHEFTESGGVYTDVKTVNGIYAVGLDSNIKANIISITDVTLVNDDNAVAIAQRVYDYYQERYIQKTRLFAPIMATSNSVLIDTLYSKQIGGTVEKMKLDLSGGFVVDAEIVGSVYVEPV